MTNEQLTQEVLKLSEQQAKSIAEHEKFQIILSEVQEGIKSNTELTIAVKEIATEMKYLREEQTDMNKRLRIIEEKPSKSWENIKWLIITRNCNSSSGFFIRKNRIVKKEVIV